MVPTIDVYDNSVDDVDDDPDVGRNVFGVDKRLLLNPLTLINVFDKNGIADNASKYIIRLGVVAVVVHN